MSVRHRSPITRLDRVAKRVPQVMDMSDAGDISERVALREKLGCKSLDWYIKNIYPELEHQP